MTPKPPATDTEPDDDWWLALDIRHSLRVQAALLCGGLTLATMFGFAELAGSRAEEEIERALGAQFEGQAVLIASRLQIGISAQNRDLRLVSDQLAAATGGEEAVTAHTSTLLNSMFNSSPDYAWIGFADSTGRVVASAANLLIESDMSDTAWFRAGRGDSYLGNLRFAPELEGLVSNTSGGRLRVFDLAMPVYSRANRFQGVLDAGIRWSWVEDMLNTVVPDSMRREQIGVTLYDADGELVFDTGVSGWSLPPDAPTLPNGQRFRGNFREDSGQAEYLTGYARSRGSESISSLGWLVTVRQPVDRALAPAAALRRQTLLTGFSLAALAGVVAWFLAGRHTRRLQAVGKAADLIRQGDILVEIPQPRLGEIARMCRALNNLLQHFRSREAAHAEAPPAQEAPPPRRSGGNRGH